MKYYHYFNNSKEGETKRIKIEGKLEKNSRRVILNPNILIILINRVI